MNLKLGENITITDYLVRTALTAEQVVKCAKEWEEAPPVVTQEAQKILDADNSHRLSPGRIFKAWIPASLVFRADIFLGYVDTDDRYHPTPYNLPMPLQGVIVQQTNASSGMPDSRDEWGSSWVGLDSARAYRVAYSLHRKALLVLPSMIETDTP